MPKVKSTLLVFSATQPPASMNFYAFGLLSQKRDMSQSMDKHCGRLDIISGKSERIDIPDAIVTLTLTVVEAV